MRYSKRRALRRRHSRSRRRTMGGRQKIGYRM